MNWWKRLLEWAKEDRSPDKVRVGENIRAVITKRNGEKETYKAP